MNIRDRQALRRRGAEALSRAAYSPGRLALIHTAAAAGLSLILTILNVLLTDRIGDTGGLSGMGLRTVLTTAKSLIGILNLIAVTFWEIGFVYAALKMARQQRAEPADLLQGFRNFWPVLRLKLLEGAIYLAVTILCINIGSTVFLMTPFAAPLAEAIQTMDPAGVTPEALMAALEEILVPLYLVMGLVTGVILVPILYRFRMARYLIMDDPSMGALRALGTSNALMRNNRGALLRLDLSFWWYYGLQLLCLGLYYGDVIAAALGITLPVSSTAALFLCFGIYCVGMLLLARFFVSPVATTYAVAYDTLREMRRDAEPRLVRNFPWDFLPEQEDPKDSQ